MNKRDFVVLSMLIGMLLAVGVLFVFRHGSSQRAVQQTNTEQHSANPNTDQKQLEDAGLMPQKPTYDTTTPSSITFIANKTHPLPATYTPDDLITPEVRLRLGSGAEQMQFRSTAHDQLKALFADALKDGVSLVFGSGYRSYDLQKQFYNSYVARDGQAAADRYSARPGTSEHQTGLAFDVTSSTGACHLETCFKDTPEGTWMAEHAHKYGFVLRYPEGKEATTGYQYEPWHFRFVGKVLATELYEQGLTLEEYFGLTD